MVTPDLDRIVHNAVIQICIGHKWGGCLAVVSKVKSWGVVAYVASPMSGDRTGLAFIRLSWEEFEPLNATVLFDLEEQP